MQKAPLSAKKSLIIELTLAIGIILSLVFSFENSDVVSPDGVLYHELANNLVDGDGYHDNVRNDFIIPPVGHPLVILLANSIGINNPLTFARILFFLGLLIAFFTTKELKIPQYFRLLILPLMYAIIPVIYDWGIEMSLFFSINLTVFCIIRFLQNYNLKTAVFLGLSIALNLLIRPVYAPFLYLTLFCAFILLIKFKRKSIPLLISLTLAAGIVNGVMLLSKLSFGDKRLSAGTYSEIPLYCANNEYIELRQVYYSSRWSELSEDDYHAAVDPLQITTTWEDRADTLKKKVISFYKNHPGKAIGGILWRATNFTYNQPKFIRVIPFIIWGALSLFLFWVRRKKLFIPTKENSMYWIGLLAPFYTVAILSLFVYVGERYNLTSNLAFILSALLCVPMLQIYLKEKKKS
ncbi:MAG: hypothetical protein MK066_04060 [Crocinitomicaceae bacterium]|nr:hypothetical protein [Crocinitomicaceae bacterium]